MGNKNTDWSAIHDDIVNDLREMPLGYVAEKYNINFHTLLSYCQRKGIKRHIHKLRQPTLPAMYFPELKRLHGEGKTVKELANYFGYCHRSIEDAMNHIYMPGEDANLESKRVYVNKFRSEIGVWLDQCFNDGVLVIKSRKRGEMVLMTAQEYNILTKNNVSDPISE